MSVQQKPTGNIIDGNEVIAVELSNAKGTVVKLFNYGAIINKFIVMDANGESLDIVLGFDRFDQYTEPGFLENNSMMGAVVGRYANRIKDGRFTLEGQTYQLPLNAGPNSIHGGLIGFDKKVWDIIEIQEQPHAAVTLQYESVDGEEGFPGNLIVDLTFELTDNDELILSYEAETDQPTILNLTHHGYFNLAKQGGQLAGHQLQILASAYLEQDENYSPTGKLIPVDGTPLDFRTLKTIGQDWNADEGYDQTLVLDKGYGDLSLAAKTIAPDGGLMLSIYTTEPVAHLYTSKYLRAKNGKGNRDYVGYDGFCIETQHHPNAVNVPEFPSTILKPKDLYTQTTIYKISQQA